MRPEGNCPATLRPVSRCRGELRPGAWCRGELRPNSHCLCVLRWEQYVRCQGASRASRVPGASGRSLCVRTHIFFPDVVMSEVLANVPVNYATAAIKTDSHLCKIGVISRRPAASPEARFHVHRKEPPSVPPGDPMDLDATLRFNFAPRTPNWFPQRPQTDECYNCRKKRHFAKECPQPKKARILWRRPYRATQATYKEDTISNEAEEELELAGNDSPSERAQATATRGRNPLQNLTHTTGYEQPGTTAKKKS